MGGTQSFLPKQKYQEFWNTTADIIIHISSKMANGLRSGKMSDVMSCVLCVFAHGLGCSANYTHLSAALASGGRTKLDHEVNDLTMSSAWHSSWVKNLRTMPVKNAHWSLSVSSNMLCRIMCRVSGETQKCLHALLICRHTVLLYVRYFPSSYVWTIATHECR